MRVIVTGGKGFLGTNVSLEMAQRNMDFLCLGRADGNLLDTQVVDKLFANADVVIHLAANVGGLGYLRDRYAEAFHHNYQMGLNVVHSACLNRVKRLILTGTPCSYASDATMPLVETDLLKGLPSGDTGSYGLAKLAVSIAANTLCQGSGVDVVTAIPSNLYGPHDNFNEGRSHVAAALICKARAAKRRNERHFDVWGDGTATRDFVFVEDVAKAIVDLAQAPSNFNGMMLNLGSGQESSISELAHVIGACVDDTIQPRFLSDRPVGYSKRAMSIELAKNVIDYSISTSLEQGIRKTLSWLDSQ